MDINKMPDDSPPGIFVYCLKRGFMKKTMVL